MFWIRYTAETDEIVRDLLKKLESATDDARTALVQHDLPAVLEAMNPSKPPELPEKVRGALLEDFVASGPAMHLRDASSELLRQREKVWSHAEQSCFYQACSCVCNYASTSADARAYLLISAVTATGGPCVVLQQALNVHAYCQ